MSAIPSDVRLESDASEPEQRRRALPTAAAAYGVAIGIAALAATMPLLSRLDNSQTSKWTTFLILAAGAAAIAHLHGAHGP